MQVIKTAGFDFYPPEGLIAQIPLERRDVSRLLVLDKETGTTRHIHFFGLPTLPRPGDCLVLNDPWVLPARPLSHRGPTGGVVEVLLLIDRGDRVWECLVCPGRRLKPGMWLSFGDSSLKVKVVEIYERGNRLVRSGYEGIFLGILERLGKIPLSPYIKAELSNPERYQTVYSHEVDSAAIPTAGLHLTCALLEQMQEMGVKICYVTLHAGLGTFCPVREEEIIDHKMHSEYCMIPVEIAEIINRTKRGEGRVICVGITSCRTIENWATEDGMLRECAGQTNIFIYPGYRFEALGCLITNFHLPGPALIMLVSALTGREHVLAIYKEAMEQCYRFFSFGDTIFIG